MFLPAIVCVGLYFEKKRTFAMGVGVCGSGVGTMVLSYVMNEIVNVRTWVKYENALLIESGIIMISLLSGFLMVICIFVFIVITIKESSSYYLRR